MVKGKGKKKGGGGSYGPYRHRGSWNPSGPYAVTWDGTIPGPGASWGHHSGGDGSWEAGGGSPTPHPPPGAPPGGGSSWTAGEESSGDASGRWVWYDNERGLDYSNIGQEFLSGSGPSVTQLVLCSEWQDGHGPGYPITPEQITGSLPNCMYCNAYKGSKNSDKSRFEQISNLLSHMSAAAGTGSHPHKAVVDLC